MPSVDLRVADGVTMPCADSAAPRTKHSSFLEYKGQGRIFHAHGPQGFVRRELGRCENQMVLACLRLGDGFGKLHRQCRCAGFQKIQVWLINQPDEITHAIAQEPFYMKPVCRF
jgi:hypothetical protein